MNKQELIERIERFDEPYLKQELVLKWIEQLEEPKKPVVPQFVAEWYEEHKDSLEVSIFDYVYRINEKEESVFKKWFVDSITKPFQTLVNMHQFGYEIEKEKRFLVKIIGITNYNSYLNYNKGENKWTIESRVETNAIRTEHTRKELEDAGFGWVFDCPGIEIEEVE